MRSVGVALETPRGGSRVSRPGAQETGLGWRWGSRNRWLEMEIQPVGMPSEGIREEKRAQDRMSWFGQRKS